MSLSADLRSPTIQEGQNRYLASLSLARSCHILIIDEDTALLTALADTLTLRLEGIIIETANSGAEGLARAECHRYNIILCDISMPDIDGLSLLPWLKPSTRTGRSS